MMKLFFLTLLFVVSFGDFSVTLIQCTTSGTCSGDDCTTTTGAYPDGCVTSDTAGSSIAVCGGGWFNQTMYASTDCSGDDSGSIHWPSECLDLSALGGGSMKATCGANTLSILFGVIMVFIASLFQ
eukprot:480864_1